MRLESGDQRGRWLLSPSCVICRAVPPSSGTVQTCTGFLLAATSTVWTVKATSLPSGETCGSPIRFNSSRALTSNGFFLREHDRARGEQEEEAAHTSIVTPVA